MREILFRGKTDKGEWVQGDLFKVFDDGSFIHDGKCHSVKVFPETIGQYTGLTVPSGKIFEGDICKHRSNYSGEYVISVITYIDGQFLAMADNNSGFNLSDKLEVIGNIHDNPELLKGGEK